MVQCDPLSLYILFIDNRTDKQVARPTSNTKVHNKTESAVLCVRLFMTTGTDFPGEKKVRSAKGYGAGSTPGVYFVKSTNGYNGSN